MPPSTNDLVVRVVPDIQASGGALSSQFKKVAVPIQKIVGDALGGALDTAFSARELGKIQKRMAKMQLEALKARELADIKIRGIEHRLHQKNLSDDEKSRLLAAKRVAGLEAKNLEDRLKKEAASVTAASEHSKKALKALGGEVTRLSADSAERFGESLAGAFSDLTSGDLGNMAGLIKKIGEGTKEKGLGMQAKAGTGPMGKLTSMLGGFLSKAGPALIALGAIAGGLFALVKILVAVDAKAKEFNKDLLEGGTAALDIGGDVTELTRRLRTMKEAFSAPEVNDAWGTLAKDHLAIINAYNESGFTPKEIVAGLKDEEQAFLSATTKALQYSKLLGMTAVETATMAGESMDTFAMSIDGVYRSFDSLILAAKESGFGTKRFVGMVLQATSGMSMYNVRLSETAALLLELTKILGIAGGEDFMKTLQSGFRDEGTTERYVRTKKMGAGYAKDLYKKEATRSMETLLEKLLQASTEDKGRIDTVLSGLFKKAGFKDLAELVEIQKKDPEKYAKITEGLTKALSKLTVRERGVLTAGVGGRLGTEMASTIRSALVHRKGAGGTAAAMQVGGSAVTFLTKLFQARKSLGGKGLHEVEPADVLEMIKAEKMGQAEGEEMMRFQLMGSHFKGMEDILARFQKRIDAASTAEEKAAIAAEFNTLHAKEFGVALDVEGKRRVGTTEEMSDLVKKIKEGGKQTAGMTTFMSKIKDGFENLVFGMEDKLRGEELERGRDMQLEYAKEVASATTSLLHFMETRIEAALLRIHGVVQDIYSALPWTDTLLDKEAKMAQSQAVSGIEKEAAAAETRWKDARSTVLDLRGQVQKEKDPEKKARLGSQLEESEFQLARAKAAREGLRVESRVVRGIRYKEEVEEHGDPNKPSTYRKMAVPVQQKEKDLVLTDFFKKTLPGFSAASSQAEADAFDASLKAAGLDEDGFDVSGIQNTEELQRAEMEAGREGSERFYQALLDAESMAARKKMIAALIAAEDKKVPARAKVQAEAIVKAEREAALGGLLQEAGVDPALLQQWLAGSTTGVGALTQEQKDMLLSRKDILPSAVLKSLGDVAHDMVLQIGSGGVKFAQRVDPNDVGVFAKPGGALAKAGGGGGGSVNIFHLYNDGPGILKTIEKAQRAGVLG